MNITLIRHPIDINTRLCDIPKDWLSLIERRIERMGTHWLWTGGVGHPRNYPVLDVPGLGHVPARRFVMHMFYDFPDKGTFIVTGPKHVCAEELCLNPKHLIITTKHPRSRDFEESLRPM